MLIWIRKCTVLLWAVDIIVIPILSGGELEHSTNDIHNENTFHIGARPNLAVKTNQSLLLWINDEEDDVSAVRQLLVEWPQ